MCVPNNPRLYDCEHLLTPRDFKALWKPCAVCKVEPAGGSQQVNSRVETSRFHWDIGTDVDEVLFSHKLKMVQNWIQTVPRDHFLPCPSTLVTPC